MNATASLPAYNVENLSVLIIDEHDHLRTMIQGVLRNLGIRQIREADTLERGYSQFCDIDPDVTLIDWTPEFDGIGLLKKIRTDPASPNQFAAVIMMTGYSESYHVHSARDAGMSSFLAKPLSVVTIYKHIVSLIDNRRPFVRVEDFFGPDRRRKVQMELDEPDRRV